MPGHNVLFLFSDEHRRDALGCYGHSLVQTPHLDGLARRGTRFTRAYTPSPICVPARASLATGQYVHRTRCWSNAQAYQGIPESWGHVLRKAGCRTDSIGKLHYRGAEHDNGFDHELLPMYIKNGIGWAKGLLRDHEQVLDCESYARQIGPGNDPYTEYDCKVTDAACNWLADTPGHLEEPWVLFVSWLRPHYPLTCPKAFYDLYPLHEMDEARYREAARLPAHDVVKILKKNFNYDDYFTDSERYIARASYYGLCSFLDYQIGRVLDSLERNGLSENTVVLYTSDHGDHNGDRGMWTKMSLYDESTGIPMIMAGPDIPKGKENQTLVSLVDLYPTILSATGVGDSPESVPGISLQSVADTTRMERCILSEYHDGGSPTGMFMLRNDRWKYNYYPGYSPELFDMLEDPGELTDLADSPDHARTRQQCHDQLLSIADPELVNVQAFSDQKARIEELGGIERILADDEFDFTPVGS